MRVATGELVSGARDVGVAVGAFNVITLEHAEAIVDGAAAVDSPVILQLSENAVRFHDGRLQPVAAALVALAGAAPVPVAVHLDHVVDGELLRRAADAGFDSVMVDASARPYRENAAVTRAAVRWAHGQGLWVEAELGEVGGKDGAHAPGARTDPGQAAAFVAETGVDALAVAVGSSHAMLTRTAQLDLDLVAALRWAVTVPLVLHGSSGVPDQVLRGAVRCGLAKINIGTALNLAYTTAVRAELARPEAPIDPRRYLGPARAAMAATVAHLLTVLRTPAANVA